MRLIHVSDLHFGPHYSDSIGEQLLEAIAKLRPEGLVITGDLTQRARHDEFVAAAEFLKNARQLTPQVVVCPGNHDIALYRFWERLLTPFARYRRYIHPELDWVEQLPGATIVALNSVRPYTRLVQGHLSRSQLEMCRDAFAKADPNDFHILALHHPIGLMDQGFHHPSLQPDWQDVCGGVRLDMILTGHVHQAAVVAAHPNACTAPLLLISCGTTTSNRGRGDEESRNHFHVLEGSETELRLSSYRVEPQGGFHAFAHYHFPRKNGVFSTTR
ncbi:metallophosphoesterase family protein [Oligoflexus tunisiensis]|uniref:metallophosphoesterase family protein n=1 Tax=Oligoflexus tunisiensis TaxID=708132 RepID=UPI00159F24C0|nr:metallophosphoesterase [Oligoflexus tunisiensis]